MSRSCILILDDEQMIRDLLEDYLSDDFETIQTDDGHKALDLIAENKIDAALVDINMPKMQGIDFIEKARKRFTDTAFIIISGENGIDAAIDAIHSGVFDFIKKPFADLQQIKKIIKNALDKRDLIAENKKYKENLEFLVKRRTKELEIKNKELIYSQNRIIGILSRAAEYKDYETGQHFIRVSQYSGIIAEALNLTEKRVEIVRQAAPVHDIGKIGIPERILLKQGRLSDMEYSEMKKHCLFGEGILRSQSMDIFLLNKHNINDLNTFYPDELLETAAVIAKSHHERYNGSGYPEGLKGKDIPLEARIVSIADVYDAIGTERAYKKAWNEKSCQEYIKENSGILFDPEAVDAFFMKIDKITLIKNTFKDEVINTGSYIKANAFIKQ